MEIEKRILTPDSFFSYGTKTSVSAMWKGSLPSHRGTASIDKLPDGTWWVSRVLVQPTEMTGKGIGGKLLELAKKEVEKQGGGTVVVCPGGYGSNSRDQRNFYKKHGFKGKDKMTLILSSGKI